MRIYIDSNNNSQYDAGEPNDITDANGLYRIFGLSASTYNVRLDTTTLPANYATTTPTLLSVTLTANQQYDLADFGIRPPGAASIGDTVWFDYNRNNAQDAGESGIPNIKVWLYQDAGSIGVLDGGDTLVKQTVTNGNGNYSFTGLYGGTYLVVANPQGTDQVQSPYGGMVNLSGMYFVPGANPKPVALSDGENYVTADFGYDWNSSIGDFVWWDLNANGTFDAGEPPIDGAQVLLYWDVANNNQWDPGDPYIDQTLTDASGIYHFYDLPPGNYVLEVYEDSFTVGGDREAIPSTPDWRPVDLGANQNYVDADWGYYDGALIQGYVFHDDNRDGSLDTGEAPLPNVTVTLTGTDSSGNPVNLTTTSDSTGYFKFVVPEGTYTVSYNTGDPDIPPALSALTTPTSYSFVAQAGPDYHYVYYFGRDNNGTIGNLVWNDANGDGIKGSFEPGIPGVTVRLYRASDNAVNRYGCDRRRRRVLVRRRA